LPKFLNWNLFFPILPEAGIAFDPTDQFDATPPKSYPAKLTRWLWERFTHFEANSNAGLYIIPCELINYNATTLKKIILQYVDLWELEGQFKEWIQNAITFCNSLVDRIVPGYPKENLSFYENQLAYKDALLVTAEPFFLWVIEGDERLKEKLSVDQINLDS
jgi:tagaturonate reductase